MENRKLMLYNLTPDLLDREVLLKLLKDRCINLPNMNTMSKEALVKLFHRVIAPLPQRTSNCRQILLTPTQSSPLLQESRGFSIGFSDASSSSSLKTNSRLKPPPAAGSSKHKTVNLITYKPQCSSNLDNIVINDRTKIKQVETQRSKEIISFSSVKKVNALDSIVINDRTKIKMMPQAKNPKCENVEERNVSQSVNIKPRIKLKRSSLSVGNSQECTPHAVEPESKKPKTKIVF